MPNQTQLKIIALAVIAIGLLFGAYMFGVRTSAPKPEVTAPAAAQSMPDGGLELKRDPNAGPDLPKIATPKGSTVERRMQVVVQPKSKPVINAKSEAVCPPVTVDLALVKQDGGRRVIASSPDGKVVGGIDVPIEPALIPEEHKWAAGLSVGHDKNPGVWVERDLGRFRVGAEVIRTQDSKLTARARIGWAW